MNKLPIEFIKFISLYSILHDVDSGNRICKKLIDCWGYIYNDQTTEEDILELMKLLGFKNFEEHSKKCYELIVNGTIDDSINSNNSDICSGENSELHI